MEDIEAVAESVAAAESPGGFACSLCAKQLARQRKSSAMKKTPARQPDLHRYRCDRFALHINR
jgi:hypothetical protein